MTKEEAKQKYNRVATDKSQLQGFVYDLIDGLIPGAGGGGDFDFATDEDIDLAFGIADIGERSITAHALILNDNDTVDVENHMLILGADGPSPFTGLEFDISSYNIDMSQEWISIEEYDDFSPLLDCYSIDDGTVVVNEPVPELKLTFQYLGNTYTVIFSDYGVFENEIYFNSIEFDTDTTIQFSVGAGLDEHDQLAFSWIEVLIED